MCCPARIDWRRLRAYLATAWHECTRHRTFCQLPGLLAGRSLLLVAGDPTHDVKVLQSPANLLCIMKDGVFHKAPTPALRAAVAA